MRIFYGIGFAAFGISFIILILNTERLNKIFSQEHVVHEDDGDGMENSYLVRKNIASFKVRETKVTEKDFLSEDVGAINQKISVDLSKQESQDFSFEVKVKEIGTNFRTFTAVFKIILVFETGSFEQNN